MARRYVPARGDAVWITLNPQAGHEQAGRRPALVLSPSAYNGKVGLAILCPITSQVKGHPFEVAIPSGSKLAESFLPIRLRISISAFEKPSSSASCRGKPQMRFWKSLERCWRMRVNELACNIAEKKGLPYYLFTCR